MKTIEEIKQENCDLMIPTKWNIYKWAEAHPDTTIAHSLKRIEKVFDFSDTLQTGFSGGKDSTISANLACLELNLRKLRCKYEIDRDGNKRIDPLDAKWANKRITMAMTDAEVVFSSTNDYSKRFLEHMGPENMNLIEFYWICLPLAWQSGVSFNSGILISWDDSKQSQWVQPMPTRDDLHGFDCININNLKTANPIPLSSLSEEAQEYHKKNGNVFTTTYDKLFNTKYWIESGVIEDIPSRLWSKNELEVVANYGRGPVLESFRPACHEKEEQDDFSLWFSNTSWLVK